MDLLLLGLGMGIVGGLLSQSHAFDCPNASGGQPLDARHSDTYRALLVVDGILLIVTFFFYRYIRERGSLHSLRRGVVLLVYAGYSLWRTDVRPRGNSQFVESHLCQRVRRDACRGGVPGTWIFWLTIVGPIFAEGRLKGYWHIVPFFAGSGVASTAPRSSGSG